MTAQNKDPHQQPGQTPPYPASDVREQQHKEEEKEVAGRHKNDGKKDHKGAR